MGRNWRLALILICLPILATVITAFRVRDLPKTPQNSVTKQKCDDCDVIKHSVKESVNTHEELKKAVREKQQVINQKIGEKSAHKYDVRSDESKDEDEMDFIGVKTGFSQEHAGVSKVKSERSKTFLTFGNNGDDDDDDDDSEGVIENIKKKLMNSDNKPKHDDKKPEDKGYVMKDKSDENDSDDDDEGDDDDIFVFKKSRIMDLLKTQPSTKSSDVKRSESKLKSTKLVNKNDNDDDDDDDEDDDDKTLTIQHKNKVFDAEKKIPKLKPDLKSSNVKQPIFKAKPLKNNGDEDANSSKYDIGKSKTTPRTESLPKVEIKTKIEVKSKPVIKEANKDQMKLSTKKDDDDDDDDDDEDTGVDDDDENVSLAAKAQPKTVSKVPKTDSPKITTTNEKETPKKSLLKLPKDDEKLKADKKPETIVKPTEPKKVDTNNMKLKDSLTKEGDQKSDKSVYKDKPKPATVDKLTPAKEEKKIQKESKSITDDKPKKDSIKKDSEKLKSSADKGGKISSHEELKKVEKKSTYEPKKIDDLRDGFKPYDYKKDTKAVLDKNHSDDKKKDKTSKEKQFDSQEVFSTTESHLKQVTDALHRRNLLKSEFEDFYAFFPTFAPNFSRIHNPECRRHGQIVLRQLRGTKLWALNMLDATAKIPSGVLRGNGIQLGDFDQCLESRARVQLDSGSVVKVQGQYCLVRLEVKAEHPELEAAVYLAQAKNLIRSRIDDPGHFLPRFSTLSWGVCVPAACNPEDVEVIVKDAIKHYQHTSGVVLRVKVDEEDCQVEEEAEWWNNWVEWPTLLTLSFYGIIILLVFVATVKDFFARRTEGQGEEADENAECDQKESKKNDKEAISKRSEGFLSAFSLYHTLNKLVAPGDKDEIACIHGIRGLATIAVLITHKALPVVATPYTNRLKLTEAVSSPLWSWCRAGWVFTDCFILLSGTLTAHRISAESDTGSLRRLFSKYLRLTPALLALVLFYAYVWDHISSGPMWGTFVTKNAQLCQEGWWWNLLYVQNYFGFEDMCAPQTHQLALDMQLTILGGMLVWVMQVKAGLAMILLPSLHFIATYLRYTTVRDHRLTMLAYHGVSGSQLFRTARLSYTSTLHRSTPYLVGLSLGLALRNTTGNNKILLALGWLSSGALWCLVWWAGIDSGSIQYRYSASFAAQYAALAPIASALAIAWVIYAVHSGSCNFLSRFLCCRPLVLISRLSYAMYLCQFIVFITNVATVKTSSEFTVASIIDVKEISAIFLLSTILTLTFVIPMQSLHKVFSFSSKPNAEAKSEDGETEQNQKHENHVTENDKVKEMPTKRHLIAHREVLEEIPETEVEYEFQRERDQLGEILEEEEDDVGEESQLQMDDELEIIVEEGGEEEEWMEEEFIPRRSYSNEEDQDADEWEWTANGTRDGAQLYRYSR